MATESRRNNYLAPQLIHNRMLANNDVCMNNGVKMERFASPANVWQNRLLPYSSSSMNLPQNQLIIGGVGSINNTMERFDDQLNVLFGTNVTEQLDRLQDDSDLIISEHIKKMKLETNLRFKRQTRLILTSFIRKSIDKIKKYEEKIQELSQMNVVLYDKMVTLSMENQSWRNLAEEKEETANSLRDNLAHMIAQARITLEEVVLSGSGGADNGCHSLCGSNNVGGGIDEGQQLEVEILSSAITMACGDTMVGGGGGARMCLSCGMIESSVFLLPCKHLCLCHVCGTTSPAVCQVCRIECDGIIRVNLC